MGQKIGAALMGDFGGTAQAVAWVVLILLWVLTLRAVLR